MSSKWQKMSNQVDSYLRPRCLPFRCLYTVVLLGSCLAATTAASQTGTAAQDSDNARLLAAERLDLKGNFRQAFDAYLVLANEGIVDAQLAVGRLYESGDGVEQNDAEAARWLERAATQGHVLAQYELAQLYAAEDSAVRDFGRANHWFQKAAEKGHAEAQFNVGVAYERGFGTEKDAAQAVKWFTKAANQGHDSAQFRLAVIFLDGEGVPRNLPESLYWFREAANNGNHTAQFNLGAMYLSGINDNQDPTGAKEWLQRSADQGNERAKRLLSSLENQAMQAKSKGGPGKGVVIDGNRMTADADLSAASFTTRDGTEIQLAAIDGAIIAVDDVTKGHMVVYGGMPLEEFLSVAKESGVKPLLVEDNLYRIGSGSMPGLFAFKGGRLIGFVYDGINK